MEDFEKRLVKEQEELQDKLIRLRMFLSSSKAKDISFAQSILMEEQVKAMTTYNHCLVLRLALLRNK